MVLQSAKKIISHPKLPILLNTVLLLFGLTLLFVSSNKMLKLELWGYIPLYFFIGLWLSLGVLLGSVFKKSRSLFYWFLSTISGVLLYLGFPDPSITPMIFLGFIPLLYIAEQEKDNKKGVWKVFRYAYSAFFLWNILTTFWVANTSFIPSFFAFGLNSLFMCIPFIGYFRFRKRFSLRLSLVAFVAFWICFEMIHLRWEISWPWLTLGNAFYSRSLWIQWYEFTGHIGGSVWVLSMNAMLFYIYNKVTGTREVHPINLLYPMLLLMGPIIISFFIYFNYQEKGELVNVSLVQPNFEPHYEKFSIPNSAQLDQFVRLTKENISDSTDYVVFPETSFSFFDIDLLGQAKTIKTLNNVIDSFPQASLITGLVTYKTYKEKLKGIKNLRETTRDGEPIFIQLQNSAVELSGNNKSYGVHVKGKLVPGAEIFPYSKLLFFLEPIVKKSGGTTAGHARSEDPTVLSSGKANVAPAICYESIYAYWMRKFVQNGAEIIFVITNDGWWDNTPGHRQHLGYSILRAIEFRRSVGRSANTGISCVIDQHGRVFQPLAYGTEGVVNATMQANKEMTFYAKYGDILGRIACLFTIIFAAFMFRWRQKNGKKVSENPNS